MLEGFGEDGRDVFEAVHERSAMDVGEWFAVDPFILSVVDLEAAVFRYAIMG